MGPYERLQAVGWQGGPWGVSLRLDGEVIKRVDDLGHIGETEMAEFERWGQEVRQLERWIAQGGDILLCPADRVAEVSESRGATVIRMPSYLLIWAFGFGLYFKGRAGARAMTPEEAEVCRREQQRRRVPQEDRRGGAPDGHVGSHPSGG